METILDRIVTHVREELPERKRRLPPEHLEEGLLSAPSPLPFSAAFPTAGEARAGRAPALIAEVKKASPSRGVIREDFDPVALARAYEANGAAAVSVLTEERFFRGSLLYLREIRRAVGLPLLRKDFIVDPYQLLEARINGADAALLIAAVLDDAALAELYGKARELGLEALVEVHDEAELERALELGAGLVGINNRDLRVFSTDLAVTERLAGMVPDDMKLVSESGIHFREDVLRVGAAGAGAVLVGEAIVKEPDAGAKAAELAGRK